MTMIEASAFIQRTVSDVFAFVSDQRNAVQWQAGLVEVTRLTEGPVGVGTRHRFVRGLMGRKCGASRSRCLQTF